MDLRTCLIPLVLCGTLTAAGPPRGSITIDRIADIKYPSEHAWSPDGQTVAFLWDAAGKQDLFAVKPGGTPVALTDFPINPAMLQSDIGRFEWASNDQIIFAKDGSLWTVSIDSPRPSRLPGFEAVANFGLSGDKREIAFVRRGQIWTANLKARTERQLTNLTEDLRPTGVSFSPDSKYVAFNASHSEDVADPLPYNGNRVRVFRTVTWDNRLGIVSVFLGDPVWISSPGGGGGGGGGRGGGMEWVNGNALVHQEFSPDRKAREIKVTSANGETRTLWKDYDSAYWTPTGGARTVASPDGKWVAFFSDRSGWPHLYVIPADATSESQARQLSYGNFGAGYASWSPDSKRIAYSHSANGNQMERFISVAELASGKSEAVVTSRGVNYDPTFSPDGSTLLYLRTAVEHPLEVYATTAHAGGTPIRLSDSLPAGLLISDLTAPFPVHYPSRASDKAAVPATLIVHKNLDRTKKHPAIIWIHGSGSDQNYLGWHPGSYRMYYSMHQYLAQQGYVILTPDYRGSSGYSRDWAIGDYMDMGGKETEDVAGGADYLKTLPYVDPDRIGIWGLSYGGYMTLQAMVTTPTLFRCAIDVAGVGDWATWNSGAYTVGRLGTPVTNPEGYETSAAVKHLSKLARPLMILQGTNDTNVPFWETLTVIDTLVKLGKPFEMAIYPGEIHFFRRAYVLRDAWRRSEEFFDKYLVSQNAPLLSSQ